MKELLKKSWKQNGEILFFMNATMEWNKCINSELQSQSTNIGSHYFSKKMLLYIISCLLKLIVSLWLSWPIPIIEIFLQVIFCAKRPQLFRENWFTPIHESSLYPRICIWPKTKPPLSWIKVCRILLRYVLVRLNFWSWLQMDAPKIILKDML